VKKKESVEYVFNKLTENKKCNFPKGVKEGNIAEGLFVAANAAKVVSPTKKITEEDVWKMVKRFQSTKKGKGAAGEFSVSFEQDPQHTLRVYVEIQSKQEYDIFINSADKSSEFHNCYPKTMQSALNEVNSREFYEFIINSRLDNKSHSYEVLGEGVSGAGAGAADVIVKVDNVDIKDFSPSLKSRSPGQIQQWSGKSFAAHKEAYKKWFDIDLPGKYRDLYDAFLQDPRLKNYLETNPKKFGGPADDAEEQKKRSDAEKAGFRWLKKITRLVMVEAAQLIRDKIKNEGGEYLSTVVKDAIEGRKTDNSAPLINLDKGLKISDKSIDKLKDQSDFKVAIKVGEDQSIIEVYMRDPESKNFENFLSIRTKPTSESKKVSKKATGFRFFRPNNYLELKPYAFKFFGVKPKGGFDPVGVRPPKKPTTSQAPFRAGPDNKQPTNLEENKSLTKEKLSDKIIREMIEKVIDDLV
jgi:hypothetical protein